MQMLWSNDYMIGLEGGKAYPVFMHIDILDYRIKLARDVVNKSKWEVEVVDGFIKFTKGFNINFLVTGGFGGTYEDLQMKVKHVVYNKAVDYINDGKCKNEVEVEYLKTFLNQLDLAIEYYECKKDYNWENI